MVFGGRNLWKVAGHEWQTGKWICGPVACYENKLCLGSLYLICETLPSHSIEQEGPHQMPSRGQPPPLRTVQFPELNKPLLSINRQACSTRL